MKTKIPPTITTVEEAKAFLTELHANGEVFHPEEDAHEIVWNMPLLDRPTYHEAERLNMLMTAIYNLPGNDGRHCAPMVFDPCEFLLTLNQQAEAHVQTDSEKLEKFKRIDGLGEDDDDDRIFSWADMAAFALKVAQHVEENPGFTYNDMVDYISEEVQYEEGDGSYELYQMPVRDENKK